MQVSILTMTGTEQVAGQAAATCVGGGDPIRSLKGALASGHESVIEHVSFTFSIKGISRVTLAQLSRHRIMSMSVMSQRYCNMSYQPAVIPPSIHNVFYEQIKKLHGEAVKLYDDMIANGVPIEDARYILPEGTTTDLVLTMNARELRHFFSLRCCNRAQWEIRELADKMLILCRQKCPTIFKNAGPGCVQGHCPEKRPCGHTRSQEAMFGGLK